MLAPKLAEWQREHGDALTIAVLSDGEHSAVESKAAFHGLDRVLHDQGGSISHAYGAAATPAAVLIASGGVIESSVAQGVDEIEALLASALAAGAYEAPPGLPVGIPIPDLTLANLDGVPIPLAGQVDP